MKKNRAKGRKGVVWPPINWEDPSSVQNISLTSHLCRHPEERGGHVRRWDRHIKILWQTVSTFVTRPALRHQTTIAMGQIFRTLFWVYSWIGKKCKFELFVSKWTLGWCGQLQNITRKHDLARQKPRQIFFKFLSLPERNMKTKFEIMISTDHVLCNMPQILDNFEQIWKMGK